MRNISVEALRLLLDDLDRATADWYRVRQSLVEYEIVPEEEIIVHPWPSGVRERIYDRIDAKQAELDAYRKKKQAEEER